MDAAQLAEALKGRKSGSGWVACCPAHDDKTPSLSINDGDTGEVVVFCHAGCSQSAVIDALKGRGLWETNGAGNGGTTVAALSAEKRLLFTREDGFSDDEQRGEPVIRIDYRGRDQTVIWTRWRGPRDAQGKTRFWNTSNASTQLYGLWRFKPTEDVILVEGETDAVALWAAGFNALGVPGAKNWHDDRFAKELKDCPTVFVHVEPDDGGKSFKAGFEKSSLKAKVRFFTCAPEAKDPCELRGQDPDAFGERIAKRLELPPPLNFSAIGSTFRDIAAKTLEPITPIIADLLYPGAWVVVGRTKIGKSWLLLQLALKMTERGTFLGYQCVPHDAEVVVFATEDTEIRIHARLTELGVIDNVPFGCRIILGEELKRLAAAYADDMTFYEFLDRYLNDCPKVRVAMIDTEVTALQIWKGGIDPEGGSPTQKDYIQGRGFDEIGLKHCAAILLSNHTGKRKPYTVDFHERINRTLVATAGVSGSIVIDDLPNADANDPDERHKVFAVRGRDLKKDVQLIIHLEESPPWWVADGPYLEVTQTNLELEILKTIESLMPDDEDDYVTAQEIGEFLECSRGSVKVAVFRMLKKGRGVWNNQQLIVKKGRKGGYRLK